MSELKPCPWGHENVEMLRGFHKFAVSCECGWVGPICISEHDAKELWNHRHVDPYIAELAAVRDELISKTKAFLIHCEEREFELSWSQKELEDAIKKAEATKWRIG